jgi:hypothetical protein
LEANVTKQELSNIMADIRAWLLGAFYNYTSLDHSDLQYNKDMGDLRIEKAKKLMAQVDAAYPQTKENSVMWYCVWAAMNKTAANIVLHKTAITPSWDIYVLEERK